MRGPEGLVRRYAMGLVMETVPCYRSGLDLEPGAKVLPGILVEASSAAPSHGGGGPTAGGGLAHRPAGGLQYQLRPVRQACCAMRSGSCPGFMLSWSGSRHLRTCWRSATARFTGVAWSCCCGKSVTREVRGATRQPCLYLTGMLVVRVEGCLESGGGWIRLYGVQEDWPLGPRYRVHPWVG